MPKFNGHKNWNHWNISLWINNDETLYHMARRCCRAANRDAAAEIMLTELHKNRIYKTPDGAKYTKTTIRAAMVGIL